MKERGLLTAVRKNDFIELNFPSGRGQETSAPKELIEGLKVTPKYAGKTA